MHFARAEYETRVRRTQQAMRDHGLPVLLLHQPENILYLSGFHTPGFFMYQALIVPEEGEPALVIRGMERAAAAAFSWVSRVFAYEDTEEPTALACKALGELGFADRTVGLDYHSWFLTLERAEALRRGLPNATWAKEPQIVDHLRLRKSAAEVEALRAASRAVEAGVAAGIQAIAEGATERDLAGAIFTALIQNGSEAPLYGNITSGSRTDQLHGQWSDRRLERGDQVYFEISGVVKQYFSKLMRTTIVGPPSADQQRTADILRQAQDDAISLMRPGASAVAIDRACRQPVLAAGLRDTYSNRTGYSTGLTFRPSSGEFLREFMPEFEWTLEPGMVLHMLLMARGIGFSDTVLVTETGHELLTSFDRKLFVSSA